MNVEIIRVLSIIAVTGMINVLVGADITVRVGVYQNKPKIFIDENGKAAGFFVDLLDKIAERENWTIVFVPCEWESCLYKLKIGEIDLMPDVAYSPERDVNFDFHKTPIIMLWSRIYASRAASIKGIPDLDGKRVAVLRGSIQQSVFAYLMAEFGYAVTLVPTSSFEQAFALARDDSVDAAIANHLFGDYFYKQYDLVKTTIDFNRVELFYATAQGRNHQLLRVIDSYLEEWIQEPQSPYYEVMARWTEKQRYHLPRFVGWLIGSLAGLFIIAGIMILLLHSQVRARTRHLERSNIALRESYDAAIEGWSRALDLRDKETEGHTQRVLDMTLRMARAAGMSEEELIHVRRGVLLHDIGKMAVEDKILNKPGKLTKEEWVIMHQHPQLAYETLCIITYLHPALDIPYCHHEKWDGTGYPRGLKGEQIPLAARLFAVVDVWDALMSDRPYRKAWSESEVIKYIHDQSGSHFDPKAVQLFFKIMDQDKNQ